MTHPPPCVATLMLLGCALRKRPGSSTAWVVTPANRIDHRLCYGRAGSTGKRRWYISTSAARLTEVMPWHELPTDVAKTLTPALTQAYIDYL